MDNKKIDIVNTVMAETFALLKLDVREGLAAMMSFIQNVAINCPNEQRGQVVNALNILIGNINNPDNKMDINLWNNIESLNKMVKEKTNSN